MRRQELADDLQPDLMTEGGKAAGVTAGFRAHNSTLPEESDNYNKRVLSTWEGSDIFGAMFSRQTLPLSLLVISLCACAGETDEMLAPATPEMAVPETSSTDAAAAPAVGALPSQATSAPAPATRQVQGPGIWIALPDTWEEQQPESNMRLAQAAIPGPGGPGQLAVFYFGEGGGGGVEANLQRWIGMMEVKPGTKARRETFESNGLRITWLDVAGTLLPSQMGMGPTEPTPNMRMLAAVVEGPRGPWFFRANGPDATMADQRDEFLAMLKSLRTEA